MSELAKFLRYLECTINLNRKNDWEELSKESKKEWEDSANSIERFLR